MFIPLAYLKLVEVNYSSHKVIVRMNKERTTDFYELNLSPLEAMALAGQLLTCAAEVGFNEDSED